MFATTPSLRDRLNLRKIALVAVIAAGAFGAELAFLGGIVASPLGGAIADLDRIPQVRGAPAEAVADADLDPLPRMPTEVTRVVRRPLARPAPIAAKHRALQDCVADRVDAD